MGMVKGKPLSVIQMGDARNLDCNFFVLQAAAEYNLLEGENEIDWLGRKQLIECKQRFLSGCG